jgi:formate hydrogenlyase subunit 3/multisubunit Na+/H+ antiporter MnhD subunit
MASTAQQEIEIEGRPVSLENHILYDFGKKMLEDSAGVGREFAATMMKFSISAIPVYIGLISLRSKLGSTESYGDIRPLLFPPVLFLAATLFFVAGYYPRILEISIAIPEEIYENYRRSYNRTKIWNSLGLVVFIGAIVAASYVALAFL